MPIFGHNLDIKLGIWRKPYTDPFELDYTILSKITGEYYQTDKDCKEAELKFIRKQRKEKLNKLNGK